MLNFFDSVSEFFSLIWQLITNFLSGILSLFSVLIEVVFASQYLIYLVPSVIYASVSIVISIGVIKLILGWGNK